jgi:AbrB family looped-hinge helix DNA binding protein
MREWVVTVDEKGRISLPNELREEMGVKAGDTIQLALEKDTVRLEAKGKHDGERTVEQEDDLTKLKRFLSTIKR